MKKFFAILTIFALTLTLASCNQNATSFDNPAPWALGNQKNEYISYDVVICDGTKNESDADFDNTVLARGVIETSLEIKANGNYLYATTYTITHTKGADAGLVDVVKSECEFKVTSKPDPIYSFKEVIMQPRPDETVNLSYKARADYSADNVGVLFSDADKEDQGYTKKKNNATTDNEIFFLAVRSISGLKTGATASLSVFNSYDFVSRGVDKHDINVSVDSDLASVQIPLTVYQNFVDKTAQSGDCEALGVNLAINDSKRSGTTIKLFLSNKTFSMRTFGDELIEPSQKVLLRFETEVYNQKDYTIASRTIATLSDYARTK